MRKLLCFSLAMAFAATASADPVWTKPGWYAVAVSWSGPEMEAGPFDDEASCQAALPQGNEMWSFSCERLEEKPEYDEPASDAS